jgi:hypothetical protein
MPQRNAWLALAALVLAGSLLGACAGSRRSSKTEDEARALIPVPICLQRLPRRGTAGSIISLTSQEYWSLLMPGFDREASTVDLTVPDCSGRLLLSGGASSKRGVRPDELVLGSGADGFKIVWLPLRSDDDARVGLLALLRQRKEFLEVYALGIHRGSVSGTRFALERMGPTLVVTVVEERCRGEQAERRCDASCSVYLAGNGRLTAQAQFPIDRVVEAPARGGSAPSEYRFSASADYRPEGVALSEKLSVVEKGRGEVRSVDLQRILRLQDGRLQPSAESLWAQTAKQLGLPEGVRAE